jgi:hypothetical protein
MRTNQFHALLLAAMTAMLFAIVPMAAQSNELRIRSVEIADGKMTVTGQNFGGGMPAVLLGDLPLTIVSNTETQIVLDITGIGAGTYSLKVTRDGGSTADASAVFGVIIE